MRGWVGGRGACKVPFFNLESQRRCTISMHSIFTILQKHYEYISVLLPPGTINIVLYMQSSAIDTQLCSVHHCGYTPVCAV
jgi:hypothetical protein